MQKLKIQNISGYTNNSAYKNYTINKFFEENYQGKHEMGCSSLRWSLNDEIKNLYERKKDE